MGKNIQSVYVTPKGHFYKILTNQKKIRIGKKEFQFLEKNLTSSRNTNFQMKKLKPLFKWSGGKSNEISKFVNYFPKSFNTFVEPFAGGASVFFHLQHKKNMICDTHYEVCCFYSAIKHGKSKEIHDFDDLTEFVVMRDIYRNYEVFINSKSLLAGFATPLWLVYSRKWWVFALYVALFAVF